MRAIKSGYAALAVASLVIAMSALSGTAIAKKCSLGAGPLVPTLSFPCNQGTVHEGHNITFKANDRNSKAHEFHPFMELTSKKPKHGRLAEVPGANGFFGEMKPVKGKPTLFTYTPTKYDFPGWWLLTPGTYYVQIQQIDSRAGVGDKFYSPVSTIHVR